MTKEMLASGDKSVKGFGDKRQFTLLASTSAAGDVLPHQVVVKGKTAGSLPKMDSQMEYLKRRADKNTKGSESACFALPGGLRFVFDHSHHNLFLTRHPIPISFNHHHCPILSLFLISFHESVT